jgi:site-specific recombinase XerD
MKKQRFNGPMGKWMEQHLALRRSLGFIYRTSEYTLDAFDQHLANNFSYCQTISREVVVSYLNATHQDKPKTRSQKVSELRQFSRFMFQFDPDTYIPEKGLVGPAKVQIKQHIFTEEEIIKLIKQTKNFHVKKRNALLPHTYATIIGLLWVTGMRIGEVVQLKIEDVDTVEGILYVRQTKFFKSRLIPLSKSTTQALVTYKEQRSEFGYSGEPGTPFFFNNRGKPCITATTPRTIKSLMEQVGLKTIQGTTPRVHDMRHSFATRWLLDFYKSNKDPTAYLAVLATYLGHANIANTQLYLHPSIELMNIAALQLQAYTHSFLGENHETRK